MRMSRLVLSLVWLAACGTTPQLQDDVDSTPTEPGEDPAEVVDSDVIVPSEHYEGVKPTPGLRTAIPIDGERGASGDLVLAANSSSYFVADEDRKSLLRFDTVDDGFTELPLFGEPSRIVRAGNDVWVTLRDVGEVVRVSADLHGVLTEVDRVSVGAEPVGIALSFHHDRLYVALSQEDAVVALDATTLEEVGRWEVPGEPKWVVAMPAAHASAELIYVVSARQPLITEIRPVDGVARLGALPAHKRFTHRDCPDRTLSMRASGDPAIGPDGRLYVPSLYVDTQLFNDPNEPRVGDAALADTGLPPDPATGLICPQDSDTREILVPTGGAYSSSLSAVEVERSPGVPSRLTPVLVQVDTEPGLSLPARAITLGTKLVPAAEVPDLSDDPAVSSGGGVQATRSYPSSVTFSEDPHSGTLAWVAIPNQGAMVVLDLDNTGGNERARGFSTRVRAAYAMRLGARSLQTSRSGALVSWSHLERDLVSYDLTDMAESVRFQPPSAFDVPMIARIDAPASPLSDDLQTGRRLFYTSADPRMAQHGSGISCESCHVDNRQDGFTWTFEDFPRQTMNLAGRVSDTLPITWKGEVATVVDEVHATSTIRMGGEGLDDADAERVAAWIDYTRAVVRPEPTDAAAVARGEALFHSEDVACSECHAGSAYTDGKNWRVAGFSFQTNTPSLRSIGSSAPYFHDGSAKTLRDVLKREGMGDTSGLSDQDLSDLEAFLRTL